MEGSDARKQGDIDTSFGTEGTFELEVEGYIVEPGGSEPLRALARTDEGKILLAMGCRTKLSVQWQYALARLTSAGQFDSSFDKDGVVIEPPLSEETLQAAQALPVSGGAAVLVLRSQLSDTWMLTRRTDAGTLDPSFGINGYVNLNGIRPTDEPAVIKGFAIRADGEGFFFVGTTRTKTADRQCAGIVFRFDASGRLDPAFADEGYALIDLPLGTSGRVTDAVLQDDGKIVVSTASTKGNGRVVRILATGQPDPDFGTNGAFVIDGDIADRNEIERLAWSQASGLWAAGSFMLRRPKTGLLLRLDDKGAIPAGFNGGKLLEIAYEGVGSQGGLAFPMHIEASAGGVTVVGRADYDHTEIKRVIVGRHDLSGALDPSFGDRGGFFRIDLDGDPDFTGFNFLFFGIDLTETHLTFEVLSGDGAGGAHPDRVLVRRYLADPSGLAAPRLPRMDDESRDESDSNDTPPVFQAPGKH